jgi:hypothetical protein
VRERLHEAELLLVTFGQIVHMPGQVKVQPPGQLAGIAKVRAGSQAGEETKQLTAAHVPVEFQFPR